MKNRVAIASILAVALCSVTRAETLDERALERMARYCLKLSRRTGTINRQSPPIDFPPGTAASTAWLSLH